MQTLSKQDVATIAAQLDLAETSATAVPMLSDKYPSMNMDDAYAIQDEIRRIKFDRGNTLAGLKMGFTSWAKMKQMGCDSPIRANLFDYFALPDDSVFKVSDACHPRVEAEVAFVLKQPLSGPGIKIEDVIAATDFVIAAIEVIDSRFQNFKFDLPSVVADNASSCRFVIGSRPVHIDKIDLITAGASIRKNGEIVEIGTGAAVLGHPAQAVAMLANMLAEHGEHIPANTFIMSGGITAAVAVEPGDHICAEFQDMGDVNIRFS